MTIYEPQIRDMLSELCDLRDEYHFVTEIRADQAREQVIQDRIEDLEAQLTAFYDAIEGKYDDRNYLNYFDYPAECPIQVPDSEYVHPGDINA